MKTLHDSVLNAWRINSRTTTFLVEGLPDELWPAALPAAPRRTIRSIAAHLHNCRCLWMRSLAKGSGISIPSRVDPKTVTRAGVVSALEVSGERLLRLFQAGLENGGHFPGVSGAFIYGAIPRDVVLFSGYALSHEAHHRGQLLLIARELGHRLPREIVAGLWQWSSRLRESAKEKPSAPSPALRRPRTARRGGQASPRSIPARRNSPGDSH
jgi:uncharacterized damage-inducible protein DinB